MSCLRPVVIRFKTAVTPTPVVDLLSEEFAEGDEFAPHRLVKNPVGEERTSIRATLAKFFVIAE
jgi:hypothetical protein